MIPMFRRLLSALLLVGAIVGFAINPLTLKLQVGETAAPIQVTAQPRDLSLVCPGAVFRAGGSTGTSLELTRAGSATVSGFFDAQAGLKLVEQRLNPEAPILGGLVNDSIAEAKSLTVQDPAGSAKQGSALLSATQVQKVALSNLSGLAAANCIRPSSDAWLVGGDTSPGRETILVLSNPSNVDSSVNLEVVSTGGPIAAPGLSSISVPKLKTVAIALSGIAPNLSTFSVHVVSNGGALGTWLQTRTIRGLTPGGIDFVGPSSDPAKSLAIPGVFLRGTAAAAKLDKVNPAYDDLAPMLRITSTSSRETTVTAQILGTNAKTFGTVIQQVVAPYSTVDLPITGLADGDYVALIDSKEPVRAAIRLSRTKGSQTDFAWVPAVAPQKDRLVFNAPAGAITKLAVANPGKQSATVTVGSSSFTLAPASSVSIVVTAGRSTSISSTAPVSASEVIDLEGLVSVVPVIDYRNLGGSLEVVVH
jgi:Family of unknown function (DUF5719)